MIDLNSVHNLRLPIWQFAIFGSGVLAVRNIRQSDDIDILVKKELRDFLSTQYPVIDKWYLAIEIWNIEIMKDWIHLYGKEYEMIDTADIIDWLPFVQLRFFKEWKQQMGREKDKKDLALLAEYEQWDI